LEADRRVRNVAWLSEHVLQLDGVQFVAHGATNRNAPWEPGTPVRPQLFPLPRLLGTAQRRSEPYA
jgi:hypothetical protein